MPVEKSFLKVPQQGRRRICVTAQIGFSLRAEQSDSNH